MSPPAKLEVYSLLSPFVVFLINRNYNNDKDRFRGIIAGLFNNIQYNFTPDFLHGGEAVFTFENLTIPFPQSELVEGEKISSEELKLNQMRLGMGIGYHRPIAVPEDQNNAFEIALTYEPGFLSFNSGDKTDPGFRLPDNTYEGRVHLKFCRIRCYKRILLDVVYRNWLCL
ncbi:hypothetical protein HZA55_06675 [Candidatus Poribacteria bacterium]|nr:hypothetical protein [Candidatus Poribacteria bacterium]